MYLSENIRTAEVSDSDDILKIYAPYVEDTAYSFEYTTPDSFEFQKRIAEISVLYPYLVYESDGLIRGYAYASRHGVRDGYYYDADLSIYINEKYHGNGIGTRLYTIIIDILKRQGYRNIYAAISMPNEKSLAFHLKIGFTVAGRLHNAGYKFDKWYDLVLLEMQINSYENPEKLILLKDIYKIYAKT